MILSNFPIPILNPNPIFSSSQPPVRSRRRLRCRCRRGGFRWDSNAESVRFRSRDEEKDEEFWSSSSDGGRRWWSDESKDESDDEFDSFDEDSKDIWDKVWIFKVFKAYGYMLPAIIASMLLATGPKAFLMALALPLGQSAISLAIEKLWGKVSQRPRTENPKSKRRPFSKSSTGFRKQQEREKRNTDYTSWVSENSESRKSGFGGWDELDNENEWMRSKSAATSDRPAKSEIKVKKGKLSKGGRYRDVPLFMRLLFAVFPFLSSWTRIL